MCRRFNTHFRKSKAIEGVVGVASLMGEVWSAIPAELVFYFRPKLCLNQNFNHNSFRLHCNPSEIITLAILKPLEWLLLEKCC